MSWNPTPGTCPILVGGPWAQVCLDMVPPVGGQGSDKHGWGLLPTRFIKMHREPAQAPCGMWMSGLRPCPSTRVSRRPLAPTPARVWPQPPALHRVSGETLLWRYMDEKVKMPEALPGPHVASAQLPPLAWCSEAWPRSWGRRLPSPTYRLAEACSRTRPSPG